MLPDEAIKEFKKIYKRQYGIELSDEEASFRANNLIKLYQAVYTDHYPISESARNKNKKYSE